MDRSLNPRLTRLGTLVGTWELTATMGEQTMSISQSTFHWLADGAFLIQRTDPPTYLAPDWQGLAPTSVDGVIGLDDHSDTFTMLYADSRGVCRTYRMTFDAHHWAMESRPGPDFFQRFAGDISDDGSVIEGRWEASSDGAAWTTDFSVTFRRLSG